MELKDQSSDDAAKAKRKLVGLSPPFRPAVAGAQLVTLTPDRGFELVCRPLVLSY